jgi:ComEC/Rec2-related protein
MQFPHRAGEVAPHNIFFFAAGGFVIGTALGGLGLSPVEIVIALLAAAGAFFVFSHLLSGESRRSLSPLLFSIALAGILAGGFYYAFDDYRYHQRQAALLSSKVFEGRVLAPPGIRGDKSPRQRVTLELSGGAGRIFLHADLYPKLSYGDKVHLKGEIVPPPPDSYGRFMAKERVEGTVFQPEDLRVVGSGGNALMRALFSLRERIKDTNARLFTAKQSAFLSGILLGDRDAFTEEFLEKLSESGTMHLTALSGLHMAIIVFALFAVSGVVFWRNRKFGIAATFTAVALFVAMTGFKVSAVRASLMAFLVRLATEAGRKYSPRNAITLAAFIIVLANPKSIVFDLGFQLSFAAVLSIIYFAPVLMRFAFFAQKSFLNWRVILAITLAAQIGVFPITAHNFANFSFSALPANIAILIVMPVLMGLGYVTALSGMLAPAAGAFLAVPTAFLTEYAITAVELFARLRIPFNPELGMPGAILYYVILVWICLRWNPKGSGFPQKGAGLGVRPEKSLS